MYNLQCLDAKDLNDFKDFSEDSLSLQSETFHDIYFILEGVPLTADIGTSVIQVQVVDADLATDLSGAADVTYKIEEALFLMESAAGSPQSADSV